MTHDYFPRVIRDIGDTGVLERGEGWTRGNDDPMSY
jgi:hypothetical protein